MKLLTILIVIVYLDSSFGLFENVFPNLSLPKGFDITNVHSFKGFNHTGLDGKIFNPFIHDLDDVFRRFSNRYNKNYTQQEIATRKENVRKSIKGIAKIILDIFEKGIEPTFTVGLNGLSDKSDDEYKQLLGSRVEMNRTVVVPNRQKRSTINDAVCQPKTSSTLPTSWDWRSQNIVTSVKSQGSCGSCWAFASTATIESQWARKTKQLIDLSEQDLVNCATTNGCNGNTIDSAYTYVINNGEAQESAQPYAAKVGQCKHYPLSNGVKISDYCRKGGTIHYTQRFSNGTVKQWDVTEDNPDSKIMRDIYEVGPVVGLINANGFSTQLYTSGVFNLANCPTSINHAITLVGWGTDSTSGLNYWIAKNSWGTSWGEQGYVRIIRGKNMCGINQWYYYPIMTSSTLFSKTS